MIKGVTYGMQQHKQRFLDRMVISDMIVMMVKQLKTHTVDHPQKDDLKFWKYNFQQIELKACCLILTVISHKSMREM